MFIKKEKGTIMYRHLDSHIEIPAENYPSLAQELGGDPEEVALAAGWDLDVHNNRVAYISLSTPVEEINAGLMNALAKFARAGDWIALQPGNYHDNPVMCKAIEFNGAGGWSTRTLTWTAFCAEY